MRFALLILVLVGSSLLSATSLPPRPWDIIRPVVHGKYLYVQIDETTGDQGKRLSADFPWTESGLYLPNDPEHPLWTADLGLLPSHGGGELLVTDDGLTAAVLNSSERPSICFYREGRFLCAWDLAGPARKPHRSETNWPGVRTSFARWEQFDNFVVVTCRTGDQYRFILETGELVRRQYATQLLPTSDELEAFEAALAGNDADELPPDEGSVPKEIDDGWVQRIPAGAEVFISGDGNVRVIVIPEAQPGGPRTVVYDGAGSELLSIPEVFPRPVFLADVETESQLGQCHSTESRRFPLVLTADGKVCASLAYSHGTRATSIRVFKQGRETALDLPITFEGDLKFSGVELAAVDGEHITVELGYGTDWWERYEVDLNAATTSHSVNFPSDSTPEESNVSRSFGWFGVLAPIGAIAFVILFLGFLAGRVTRRS